MALKSYKVVALVSGGKDSCFSMLQCVAAGHEIVALANLRPKDLSSKYLIFCFKKILDHESCT
jgi:diphthamide synthase (EF-2-diphthine--ammonia ligase)